MTTKIIKIEDVELTTIGGISDYLLIPNGIKTQIGLENPDGTKIEKAGKRALMYSDKYGFFVAFWGKHQQRIK